MTMCYFIFDYCHAVCEWCVTQTIHMNIFFVLFLLQASPSGLLLLAIPIPAPSSLGFAGCVLLAILGGGCSPVQRQPYDRPSGLLCLHWPLWRCVSNKGSCNEWLEPLMALVGCIYPELKDNRSCLLSSKLVWVCFLIVVISGKLFGNFKDLGMAVEIIWKIL